MARNDVKIRNTAQMNVRASEGAGTTTLTKDDFWHQVFNLSAARTCVLPSSGIKKGHVYRLENVGTFALTVQASDATTIATGATLFVALQDTPTTSSHWSAAGQVNPGVSAGLVSSSGLKGNTTGNAIAAGYVGETLENGASGVSIVANNAYVDIVSLTLTTGVWLVTSGGFCASGASVTYSFSYKWKIKGTVIGTDGKSVIYGVGNPSGDRASSICAPITVVVASGDADKTVKVQVAMSESGSPTRSWTQHIQAIRIA